MRAYLAVALAALVAPLTPSALAEPTTVNGEWDLLIEMRAGGPLESWSRDPVVADARETPGQSAEWDLDLERDFTIVEVRAADYFDVERVPQILPRFASRYFTPIVGDVAATDGTALVANLSGAPGSAVLRLGIPLVDEHGKRWSSSALNLSRDVTPPSFEIGEPYGATPHSFVLETSTSEFAFGDLRIRPAAGGEEVVNPTPTPAFAQAFPIQGLDSATDYSYRLVFTDWSGNVAESAPRAYRTIPEPVKPLPVVLRIDPPADAELPSPVASIAVAFESPESPVLAGGVRLFVDKQEVTSRIVVAGGLATFTPATPLGPGRHSASVEVTNEAGGAAIERWTFTVVGAARAEGEASTPGPGAAVAVVALLAALALSRATYRRASGRVPRR